MERIILASNSPRRKELLTQAGIDFEVFPADIDENSAESEPDKLVRDLSRQKALWVSRRFPGRAVLAADTVVAFENNILGKPESEKAAFNMLKMLSGREHFVYTGVCVVYPDGSVDSFCEATGVTFFELSAEEIRAYIKTGEPMDKAGAYGIQGKGAVLVESIRGDYYTVMGLPLAKVSRLLKSKL